jgi:hypothetical protein
MPKWPLVMPTTSLLRQHLDLLILELLDDAIDTGCQKLVVFSAFAKPCVVSGRHYPPLMKRSHHNLIHHKRPNSLLQLGPLAC